MAAAAAAAVVEASFYGCGDHKSGGGVIGGGILCDSVRHGDIPATHTVVMRGNQVSHCHTFIVFSQYEP